MNINQLESFSLAESAKFKDHLNPTLWDRHENLKNAVKDQILVGAEEYCSYLGLSEEQVVDIVVAGSNASYLYESKSSIDVVVIANLNPDETFREFFNEHKYKYNGQHRVEVDGHLVQFYVQPAEQSLVTSGSYSLIRESWVQIPVRRTLREDTVKQLKALDLAARPKAPKVIKKKIVKERKPTIYGFGRDYLAEVGLTPDGVSASTCQFANETTREPHKPTDKEIIQDFVQFCADKLDLQSPVNLKIKRDPQWSVRNKTFGRYNNDHGTLEVAVGQRHIMDVLRTVAHELTHQRQHETVVVPPDAGEDGSEFENEANASAGVLMRLYGKAHPELFDFVDLNESSGYIPTAAEADDPRFEMALSVDVRPGALGKAANALDLNTDSQGHPQLLRTDGMVDRLYEEYNQFKKKTLIKFKPCTQSGMELSATLQKSYKDIYEQTNNRWYPHRCSQLAQYIIKSQKNIIKENEQLSGLKKFQNTLKNFDCRSQVKINVGNPVSIIQVIPHIYDNLIELLGFKTPKVIKNIHKDSNDNIEWLEFSDGSTYPDRHFIEAGKGGGELEGTTTLFFPDKNFAEKTVTSIGYAVPDGWDLSSTNISES